jgi:hypothetical protein
MEIVVRFGVATALLGDRSHHLLPSSYVSIGSIFQQQRIRDNDAHPVLHKAMLIELLSDNGALERALRETLR